jgi:PAS domain S-box-containing protein
VRRPLTLVALATALPLACGLLPGQVGVTAAVTLNFLAVGVTIALLVRAGRRSAHPAGWRWYTASVAVGAGGALLTGAVLPWGQTALGSVPGQLLVVMAIIRMLDRASLRTVRWQLATMLTLFVVADLLTVHTIYRITIASSGVLPLSETVALFALLFSIAIGTGLSLVLIAVSGPEQRRVGWVLFAGSVVTALAGASSSVATGPGPVQYLACAASVLGMGLLPVACRLDQPCPRSTPVRTAPEASTIGAVLPHATALVGGSLLLLSVPLTGRLTVFGASLGVAGLGVLLAHQTVSWRVQQRLTSELLRSEAYFRTLVRGSADPVVILDEELRVRWASPTITELLGLDPEHTLGLSFATSVHPDDAPGLLGTLSAATGDADSKTRTARVRHVDGRYRLIQARIRDLRSDPDVGARAGRRGRPQHLQHHRPGHRAAQPLGADPAAGRHPAPPVGDDHVAGRARRRRAARGRLRRGPARADQPDVPGAPRRRLAGPRRGQRVRRPGQRHHRRRRGGRHPAGRRRRAAHHLRRHRPAHRRRRRQPALPRRGRR